MPANGDDVSIHYEVSLAVCVITAILESLKSPGWFPEELNAKPAFRIISRRITDLKTRPRLLFVGPNPQDHVLTEVSQEKIAKSWLGGFAFLSAGSPPLSLGPLSVTLSGRLLAKL